MSDFTKEGTTVFVREGKFEDALRKLKRRLTQEGVFKEMRERAYYVPRSVKRVVEKNKAKKREQKRVREHIV